MPPSEPSATDIECLRKSELFDVEYYLSHNRDVALNGGDPVRHYLMFGASEGRNPSDLFSTSGYLALYPDVVAANLNPLLHFIRYGLFEGREAGLRLRHFEKKHDETSALPARTVNDDDLKLLENSSLFDADYYCQTYSDVAASHIKPALHYLSVGASEGRDPSKAFSTNDYLQRYRDVRGADINPLVHYLRHGKTEGRSISQARQDPTQFNTLYEERWSAIRPIQTLPGSTSGNRITVVTDSVEPSSLFGGVGTALIIATLLANKLTATLRLVTTIDECFGHALETVLTANGIALNGSYETEFLPRNGARPLSISDHELILTTSWWSTYAVVHSVPPDRIVYILQEDERMFYPFGDERLLCTETIARTDVTVLVNTKLLLTHFFSSPDLEPMARKAIAFEPAFPGAKSNRKIIKEGKRNFFFYSRPNNLRNLFWRGGAALCYAIEEGIFDPAEWTFYWVGKDTPQLALPRGAEVKVIQGLDWTRYQELVSKMDGALVLMDTPHPSYPPMDLAAAGVAVLTNTHGEKNDLSQYSRNILMSPSSLPGLISGLKQLQRLAYDDATRMQNMVDDGISRNWENSLDHAINTLASRFLGK